MWHGTSDSAVRRLSVPCSGRKRQSSLNWCASSVSEGCSAPDPAGGVPLPTRDWPMPTPMGKHPTRPGYRKRSCYQIWWPLSRLDSSLAGNHEFLPLGSYLGLFGATKRGLCGLFPVRLTQPFGLLDNPCNPPNHHDRRCLVLAG